LQKNKSIFNLSEVPAQQFAGSLGLLGAPKIRFLNKRVAADKVSKPTKVSSPEVETQLPGIRTKYDRMFERKNQNVLSTHYNKLIDKPEDDADEANDFITLKRADHELDIEPVQPDLHAENLSKRKLKLGRAKRAVAKYGGLSQKIVFDEAGNPHDAHEMAGPEEFFKDGLEGAKEAGKKFAESERSKMKDRDVLDKEEAKEKKRERKRRRKERENGVRASTHVVVRKVHRALR
jgi:ATP-dependent RNA helicase DDX10/DBP4